MIINVLKIGYKFTSNEYPQITKDLILTSCHSILVDGITDQENKVLYVF